MTEEPHYDALGAAVGERRKELAMSIRDAAAISRRIDIEDNGEPGRVPGLGETTWSHIGQGRPTDHYAHTLHLLDQTLDWPEGKAHAILHGTKVPDGPPTEDPCPCARRRGRRRADTNGRPVSTTKAEVRQDEVDLLRREVLRLIDRVEGFEEKLEQALRSVK